MSTLDLFIAEMAPAGRQKGCATKRHECLSDRRLHEISSSSGLNATALYRWVGE